MKLSNLLNGFLHCAVLPYVLSGFCIGRWLLRRVADSGRYARVAGADVDGDVKSLDSEEDWNREEHKFCSVTSFTASKETVHWIRNYLFDTLHHVKKHAGSQTEDGGKWGGWFEEKNWIGWQEHMTELVSRLDTLLESSEAEIELITLQRPKYQEMENNREAEHPLQTQFGM